MNLRAEYLPADLWEFKALVENVFDKEYFTGAGDNFGLGGFRLKPHPRVYGGNVTFRFGNTVDYKHNGAAPTCGAGLFC